MSWLKLAWAGSVTCRLLLTGLAGLAAAAVDTAPRPLQRAHSHNDYTRPRPLADALDCGFCSLEADIHLVDGRLLVGHDSWGLKPDRTLERLYLEPLQERVRKHGGRVYPNGPEVSLLVDIKTDADRTYEALHRVLERYAEMLTQFRTNAVDRKAILVVLSGNRPLGRLAVTGPVRYATLDGRLADLDTGVPKELTPWISENWAQHFKWRGNGPFAADEQDKLRKIVERAHQRGRRVRFWGAPDSPAGWAAQLAAGVDLINTDRLTGLRAFLLEREEPANPRPAATRPAEATQ